MKWLYIRADRYVYITKRLPYRLQRRRFMNYLELYRSAYTTKRLGYRLLTIVVINKSLIDLHTPLNDPTKKGFIKTLEYRSAYTTKYFGIAYNEGLYTRTDRYVYITKRLSYRVQRRRLMNYLVLYRSAYTTKRLWYRLQWSGYTLELIDMSTSLKGFRIAYKEGDLWTI